MIFWVHDNWEANIKLCLPKKLNGCFTTHNFCLLVEEQGTGRLHWETAVFSRLYSLRFEYNVTEKQKVPKEMLKMIQYNATHIQDLVTNRNSEFKSSFTKNCSSFLFVLYNLINIWILHVSCSWFMIHVHNTNR